jgi:hypothetical protein
MLCSGVVYDGFVVFREPVEDAGEVIKTHTCSTGTRHRFVVGSFFVFGAAEDWRECSSVRE